MFEQLNESKTGGLTTEEFISIYDAVTLRWSPKDPPEPWYARSWTPLRIICKYSRKLIMWPYFEHIVCKY